MTTPQEAPQAPNKKPLLKRLSTWIGIVAVVAVIAIAVNMQDDKTPASPGGTGGAGQPTAAAPADPGTGGTGQPTAAAPADPGIGDAITSGPLEITVTKVEKGVKSIGQSPLSKEPQGQYVVVSISVKNVSKKAELLSSGDVKLLSADGAEYSAGDELYLGKEALLFEKINPGNTVTGKLAFDVPADVNPTTLEFSGSLFSKTVKVKLG